MKKLLFIVSLLFAESSFAIAMDMENQLLAGTFSDPRLQNLLDPRPPENRLERLLAVFSDQLTSNVLVGTFLFDAVWEYTINQNFRNATTLAVSGIGVLVVSRKARNYIQKALPEIKIDDDDLFGFKIRVFGCSALLICLRLYCGINRIRI